MTSDAPTPLRFLPVGLALRARECVVVGGGVVATRKALTLIRAGAHVTIVSPTLTPELADLAQRGALRHQQGEFQEAHLAGAYLVVAATDDLSLNTVIARESNRRGVLVCDASSAEQSQLIFGALLDADDATIAVFTDGRNPVRARDVRDRIGNLLSSQPFEPGTDE